MPLTDIKSNGTPARMRNRVYVFAISSLAAALLAIAFVKPHAVSTVSKATIQVPEELGPLVASSISDQIQSIGFLSEVGRNQGIASGVDPALIEDKLDDWANNVRETLVVQTSLNVVRDGDNKAPDSENASGSENAATDGGVEIVLQYMGIDDEQSLLVMNSLLATLKTYGAPVSSSASSTPKSRMRVRAIERRLGQAKQSLELYVTEELHRKRANSSPATSASSSSVSVRAASVRATSHPDSAFPELTAPVDMAGEGVDMELPELGVADSGLSERLSDSAQRKGDDWLAEQKAIDEANNLTRNPEYDVLVRALVRSQSERQELLIRFEPTHASIRRVETEIAELELLVSHTQKYLTADGIAENALTESSERAKTYRYELASAKPFDRGGFDEAQAMASIRESKPFQSLSATIRTTESELQNATDPDWISAHTQTFSIVSAPELTNSDLAELPWSKVVFLGAIASLLGFVLSRMGDSIRVPEVFYSILDVSTSLQIPVVGQLAMDGTPPIPRREHVASVGFWRTLVRMAEYVVVIMLVAFVLMVVTHPSLLSELTANPVATYMHAFQEFRNYVPIPYLFT